MGSPQRRAPRRQVVIYLPDEKSVDEIVASLQQPSTAVVERPCVEAYATIKSNDRAVDRATGRRALVSSWKAGWYTA